MIKPLRPSFARPADRVGDKPRDFLRTLFIVIITILALAITPSAFAHHKENHDGGPGHDNGNEQHSDEKPDDHPSNNGNGGDSDDKGNGKPSNRPGSGSDPPGHQDDDEDSSHSGGGSHGGSSGSGGQNSPTHGCAQANENDGDPYDSTCDESPSGNGRGNGQAIGKPCAGCVGAADNKNPLGQMPDGSDHNQGYECDGNQGIGKTNPAHTGCGPRPTVVPDQELSVDANCFNVSVTSSQDIDQIVIRFTDGSTTTYHDSAVGTTFTSPQFDKEVASVTAVSGNLTETATVTEDCVDVEPCDANPNKPGIQPCVPPQGPIVGPVVIEPPTVQPKFIRREVVEVARQRPPGQLPVTGLSMSWFLLLGIALIGAGLMMLYPSRRRCQ